MTDKEFIAAILDFAKEKGADKPMFADTTSRDFLVILDSESNRTWRVELREF